MIQEIQLNRQEKLAKFIQHLEESRQLQQDWIDYGLECVDIYVEDVDGDWLEKWGEDDDDDLDIAGASQNLGNERAIELVTEFLESDDIVAARLRKKFGWGMISRLAVELEKCLNLSEEYHRIFAVKNVLVDSLVCSSSYRDSGDEYNDEIDLLHLAESLVEKLAKIRG
ncbi:MAG TPA: hypothetical protein DEG17_01255 [Cyanobacteria bacterium UBA11149]|nr:hypothetical protein [Cyanobacteria bacterium UBA11367]HBE56569.1 hypothetical protein [Cyanobacteria bacterium UBA11366]HBK63912.1 hypothetical protein [Cyanobacteria bacterium UBA11166]HBS72544.1 hypothetical protein [Cyanobacteria bacterium UBA11153]HBW87541.1 hypothetical protein [Cyanobacteria bacterium UBA11149]HCA96615.1 hypothetical protein [Cyanobacteria bacterium UBA9226]